jgi:hypothetical protein
MTKKSDWKNIQSLFFIPTMILPSRRVIDNGVQMEKLQAQEEGA